MYNDIIETGPIVTYKGDEPDTPRVLYTVKDVKSIQIHFLKQVEYHCKTKKIKMSTKKDKKLTIDSLLNQSPISPVDVPHKVGKVFDDTTLTTYSYYVTMKNGEVIICFEHIDSARSTKFDDELNKLMYDINENIS